MHYPSSLIPLEYTREIQYINLTKGPYYIVFRLLACVTLGVWNTIYAPFLNIHIAICRYN